MHNRSARSNWILDAGLFVGFLLSFFLDLTSLETHQWLGLTIGAGLIFHITWHSRWIRAVFLRLGEGLPPRTILNAALDLLLTAGFIFILASGLALSTWFSLPLSNYTDLRDWHEWISLITLLTVSLKILLHARWILHTIRQWVQPASFTSVPGTVRAQAIGRRQFLGFAGCVGVASLLTAAQTLHDAEILNATEPSVFLPDTLPRAVDISPEDLIPKTNSPQPTSGGDNPASEFSSSTPEDPAVTTPDDSPVSEPPVDCIRLCPRRCAFPGQCRRYRDANNNGYCDIGECA